MIHNYMEHVERIKMQQFSDTSESNTVGRVRWEVESGRRLRGRRSESLARRLSFSFP